MNETTGGSGGGSGDGQAQPRRPKWVGWLVGLGLAAFAGWSLTWAVHECGPALHVPMGWDDDQIKAHNQNRLNTCLRPWEIFTEPSEDPGTGAEVAVSSEGGSGR